MGSKTQIKGFYCSSKWKKVQGWCAKLLDSVTTMGVGVMAFGLAKAQCPVMEVFNGNSKKIAQVRSWFFGINGMCNAFKCGATNNVIYILYFCTSTAAHTKNSSMKNYSKAFCPA